MPINMLNGLRRLPCELEQEKSACLYGLWRFLSPVQWFASTSTKSRAWFASGDSGTSLDFTIVTPSDNAGEADAIPRAMPNVSKFQSSAAHNITVPLSMFQFYSHQNPIHKPHVLVCRMCKLQKISNIWKPTRVHYTSKHEV